MTYNLQNEIDEAKTVFKTWRSEDKGIKSVQEGLAVKQEGHKLLLYKVLAKNLEIIENVITAYDKNNIKMQLENRKIKTTSNTTIETKIVKLTMTKDRKQAAVYAGVLKEAKQQKIDSKNFVDWLVKQGGIEKLRNKERLAKQIERDGKQFDAGVKLALATSKLATVSLDVAGTQQNDLVLLVGRVDSNNEIDVINVAGVGENNDLLEQAVRNIKKAEDDKAAAIKAKTSNKDKAIAALLSGKTAA
jgi:ribosome-binding factor A